MMQTLTPQCDVALTRIFRVFDQRNRGVLGTAELGAFQEKTFGLLLASHEMNSILEVIRSETRDAADRDAGNPDAENPVAVIVERDGSMSLTEIGFKRVITMFIQQVFVCVCVCVCVAGLCADSLGVDVPCFAVFPRTFRRVRGAF
jgi:hypothetical protein